MNIIENKMKQPIENIISIAERDGNTKRKYLLLNKLQAKYNPVKAKVALDMFDDLAKEIPNISGKIIVIGFAETATAIGAQVAYSLFKRTNSAITYLTTTRELSQFKAVVEFKEEHSHAVEQILYGSEKELEKADYIVFVEDEVTTGNTICNCVKKLNLKCKYLVASLLNCMSDEEINRFNDYNITPYWLIRTDKEGFDEVGNNISENMSYLKNNNNYDYGGFTRRFFNNPKFLGANIEQYYNECVDLAYDLIKKIESGKDKKVLILGTEECMYPSIIIANELDKKNINTFVQSTTRVPACTNNNGIYPLTNRYKTTSFYGNRDTYIYNLVEYDEVYIVSDGNNVPKDLVDILMSVGTKNITYFLI